MEALTRLDERLARRSGSDTAIKEGDLVLIVFFGEAHYLNISYRAWFSFNAEF